MNVKWGFGAVAVAVLGWACAAQAAQSNWTGTTGNWTDATWSPALAAAYDMNIGNGGTVTLSTIYDSGSTATSNGRLFINNTGATGNGTLTITATGSLTVGAAYIGRTTGYSAIMDVYGTFKISTAASTYVGYNPNSGSNVATGTLNIYDGATVTLSNLIVANGSGSVGTLHQYGGSVTVNTASNTVFLGVNSGVDASYPTTATYIMDGGSLTTKNFCIGYNVNTSTTLTNGNYLLDVTQSSADISIYGGMYLGTLAKLNAVAGTTIKFLGAIGNVPTGQTVGNYWSNFSTNAANLNDLKNLTLVIAGGDLAVGQTAGTIEIASQDFGADTSGFNSNFALDTLQIGEGATHGNALLVDLVANSSGIGTEVLYVDTLIVTDGSTLDLGGKTLYYVNDGGIAAGSVVNGTLVQIPEPATMALLLIGGGLAALRRRKA